MGESPGSLRSTSGFRLAQFVPSCGAPVAFVQDVSLPTAEFAVTAAAGCRTWVVGLGSPHGDDRVGWAVAARLAGGVPAGTRVEAAADPLALADPPAGCELLVVVDASRGAGPPGSVHRIAWPDANVTTTRGVSSHGVGLAAALDLAAALGRLPRRVVVFAVEGESAEATAELSPTVEVVVPEVVARVIEEINPAHTGGRT